MPGLKRCAGQRHVREGGHAHDDHDPAPCCKASASTPISRRVVSKGLRRRWHVACGPVELPVKSCRAVSLHRPLAQLCKWPSRDFLQGLFADACACLYREAVAINPSRFGVVIFASGARSLLSLLMSPRGFWNMLP